MWSGLKDLVTGWCPSGAKTGRFSSGDFERWPNLRPRVPCRRGRWSTRRQGFSFFSSAHGTHTRRHARTHTRTHSFAREIEAHQPRRKGKRRVLSQAARGAFHTRMRRRRNRRVKAAVWRRCAVLLKTTRAACVDWTAVTLNGAGRRER